MHVVDYDIPEYKSFKKQLLFHNFGIDELGQFMIHLGKYATCHEQ